MNQRIVGFHLDDEGHWVADLECGHGQHVRHNPPLVTRLWVLTRTGRDQHLGTALNCIRCEEEACSTIPAPATVTHTVPTSTPIQFKKKNPKALITTKFGTIELRFFADDAPRHVDNFVNLAKIKFFDGTTFHRVVPKFLIQGGDPLSKNPDRRLHGTGDPGYTLTPEPNDRPHRRGTLSMAKIPRSTETTRNPSDNGSQFFICVEDAGSLDRNYTVFGKVVRGMDVVDKIAEVKRDEWDNPLNPIEMTVTVEE